MYNSREIDAILRDLAKVKDKLEDAINGQNKDNAADRAAEITDLVAELEREVKLSILHTFDKEKWEGEYLIR